ncbi:hypothetical protein XH93_12190 [Bradyrhizobium sp. CCBAU 51753]|nr:hypothetical protein XH93_12190 [Bradyrhizobium sp. CCBAU 51753]
MASRSCSEFGTVRRKAIEKLELALSQIAVSSLAWREAFACLGAFCVGGTTWTRLTVLARGEPPVRAG